MGKRAKVEREKKEKESTFLYKLLPVKLHLTHNVFFVHQKIYTPTLAKLAYVFNRFLFYFHSFLRINTGF